MWKDRWTGGFQDYTDRLKPPEKEYNVKQKCYMCCKKFPLLLHLNHCVLISFLFVLKLSAHTHDRIRTTHINFFAYYRHNFKVQKSPV